MKKNVTMITLLLLIAGILSGCGNKPNEVLQQESVQTAAPGTENPTAEPESELEPEPEETQPKFDVAKDVLLSYEYDSNDEISKVVFTHHEGTSGEDENVEFSEIKTTHDANGYLTSITTESKGTNGKIGRVVSSIEAKYNTDGQIISLTCMWVGYVYSDAIYNYEVVYTDNYTKVYITSGDSKFTRTEIYDANCNLLSREEFKTMSTGEIRRLYIEYVNGIRSHIYEYIDSTGQLVWEYVYHDNGNLSERYAYDEKTGELKNHYRYDRNGDLIK